MKCILINLSLIGRSGISKSPAEEISGASPKDALLKYIENHYPEPKVYRVFVDCHHRYGFSKKSDAIALDKDDKVAYICSARASTYEELER